MSRAVTRFIHSLDHAIGRLGRKRPVLVELRTPVYHAVLGPVFETLEKSPDVELSFTSEYPELIKPLVGAGRFITHEEAEWRRFDLYMNADPWAAAAEWAGPRGCPRGPVVMSGGGQANSRCRRCTPSRSGASPSA